MKKKILIGALGAAVLFGGAFVVSATNNDDFVKTVEQTKNTKALLSVNEAEKIALQQVNGIVESIELERKSNKLMYEVEVEKADQDYDVYIDAYTGEIYAIDRDDDFDDDVYTTSNQKIISKEEAIAIAEKKVNGKAVEIDRDEDDGFIKYEIELKTSRGEAEVEIDALTGNVLEVEWDD